jgi:glycerol-3-phosphate dehydrogenase subunit B
LSNLRAAQPRHPYTLLGKGKILSAMGCFQNLTRSNLPYSGDFNSNTLIPTALGTFHPTCLVPETMKNGNLSFPGHILLLGLEGLKDFSSYLASANLNLLKERGLVAPIFRAETLAGLGLGGKTINSINLAEAFDDPEFRDRFARRVKPLLKEGEKLGLPAVLGFRSSYQAWADLQKKLEAEIFEIPLPPPSIPGLRLYNFLRDSLQGKGVRTIIGLSVLKPLTEAGKIRAMILGDSRKSPIYRASAFVLATGKFVGGGLDAQRRRVFESLFDLPVQFPGKRGDWFRPQLLTLEGQPFNTFGVEVNDNLQPVDTEGKVVYRNLFAAGGILARADSMAEKSGGGIAIATGYAAGRSAAARAEK